MRAVPEHPHCGQGHLGAPVALGAPDARISEWQLDVRDRAGARHQVEALEDEPDLPVAEAGEPLVVDLPDVDPIEQVPARGGASRRRGLLISVDLPLPEGPMIGSARPSRCSMRPREGRAPRSRGGGRCGQRAGGGSPARAPWPAPWRAHGPEPGGEMKTPPPGPPPAAAPPPPRPREIAPPFPPSACAAAAPRPDALGGLPARPPAAR